MKKKKNFSVVFVFVLAVSMLTACADADTRVSKENFLLSYYDGSDTTNGYDTELLYNNDSYIWGADTGVIYVSEEQSAEYGGWYYQYMSSTGRIAPLYATFVAEDGNTYREAVQILRSKDLVDWEICGAVDSGMGLMIGEDEWVYNYVWAPEVIFDENSGKYFMYFSAQVQELTDDLINKGARYKNVYDSSGARSWQSELHLGIAVSDTPVGPFRLVSSENVYGDSKAKNPIGEVLSGINPAIMFQEHYDMGAEFAGIDLHPFRDGNGDLYLYFVKHASVSSAATEDDTQTGNHIWGIKMLDMVTPDYSSITKLIGNKTYVSVSYLGGNQNEWDDKYPRNLDTSYEHTTVFPDGTSNDEIHTEGHVVEAPQVIATKDKEGNTVYVLSYSVLGVGNYAYDVHYAYSYSPLGPYTKAQDSEGNAILELDANNDFETNLGHHDFVEVGDETYIVYAGVPAGMNVDAYGRAYAVDSVSWQWRSFAQSGGEKTEILIPIANGPTRTLQPKSSAVIGYHNVAKDAEITVSSGEGAEFLNDGIVTTTKIVSNKDFVTNKDSLTVTLKFDNPTAVRGILLYNSYEYLTAFKSIESIRFELAETPESYTLGEAKSCLIKELGVDTWTINDVEKKMRPGGGAVATFDEIMVNSIIINISEEVAGELAEGIGISEIYVIGK